MLLAGYGLVRPVSEALFLEYFGQAGLPWTWIAVALGTALAVAAVNRGLARTDVVRLFAASSLAAAGLLALCWLLAGGEATHAAVAVFVLYVGKDVYVVVLLEQIWSLSNLQFDARQATRFYGLFSFMGSLGGMLGNLAVRQLSSVVGALPLLAVGAGLTALAGAVLWGLERGAEARLAGRGLDLTRSPTGGLRLLRRSRYLLAIAGLVGVIQIVITLLDYQLKGLAHTAYGALDARAAFFGTLYLAVDLAALAAQLLLVPLALWRLGATWALLITPLVVLAGVCVGLLHPGLAVLAGTFVAAKGLDYSLTRAAKEMLYLPLGFEPKYKAKAVIDVFVYRAAKGLASAGLLLVPLAGAAVATLLAAGTLGWTIVWLGLVPLIRAWRPAGPSGQPPPDTGPGRVR